jgi:diphthine synthase
MTLYLIGLGLSTEKDITLRGLELIKTCDIIYLENYTSLLQTSLESLEQQYQKKIILADRKTAEQLDEKIVEEAKTMNVAFLIIGDPVAATTHIELFKLAKEKNINVQIIHNASILTAIGTTGLQLYKFGKITSIPFIEDVPLLETPYLIYRENNLLNTHTLFLLDLKPEQKKFMTINKALEILESIEKKKQENIIKKDTLVIGCARLGCENYLIKAGPLEKIKQFDFGLPPYCLIIPAKNLHFIEKEMLELWK